MSHFEDGDSLKTKRSTVVWTDISVIFSSDLNNDTSRENNASLVKCKQVFQGHQLQRELYEIAGYQFCFSFISLVAFCLKVKLIVHSETG